MLRAGKFFHQSVPRSPIVSRVPRLQLPRPLVFTGKEATCALGERSVSCVESLQEVQEVKEESQAWWNVKEKQGVCKPRAAFPAGDLRQVRYTQNKDQQLRQYSKSQVGREGKKEMAGWLFYGRRGINLSLSTQVRKKCNCTFLLLN